MDQIHQACWDRWLSLKSCLNLIRLKRENGLNTESDKEYATRVLSELKMYYDADLMPAEIRADYENQVASKYLQ